MADNLFVSGEEMVNVSDEVGGILTEFVNENTEFENVLTELNNHWVGDDYNTMRENLQSNMKPVTGAEGTI